MTTIRAKRNLYNAGKCFTKGKLYIIFADIKTTAALMDLRTVNDLGQDHIIGNWWKDFEIIKT